MYEKRQRELKTEGGSSGAAAKKKLEKLEKDLRQGQKEMALLTMKTTVIIGLVTSVIYFSVQRRCVAGC